MSEIENNLEKEEESKISTTNNKEVVELSANVDEIESANSELQTETEVTSDETEKVGVSNEEESQEQDEVINEIEASNAEGHIEKVVVLNEEQSQEQDEIINKIKESNAKEAKDHVEKVVASNEERSQQQNEVINEIEESNAEDTEDRTEKVAASNDEESLEHDEVINEIEESNAEDAEDEGNKERHTIEVKEYDKMSLEVLAIEFEKLVKNEKIQAIKSHANNISNEFKTKFQALLDEKKTDFLNDGGNEIDFYYSSPIQKRFKEAYRAYRNKLNDHYKSLEKNLKQNLVDKLEIIEELKGLINVEENINTTYKHFKELQERWRTTGAIPRDKYNNAWNSYHHHVELFYDFLHLNRDLRDLDFKHNLDKKLKIIERAEELAQDDNVMRAFRELQELHKMWKEELGPVGKEHRETIWERFRAATKLINDKRQGYYKEIDKVYEKNLEVKHGIITQIDTVNAQESNSHGAWQKKIKEIEALRNDFFNAGKVPIKVNEATWAKFKDSVRTFNKQKNIFYKNLKKDQYENLNKKLELIRIAEDNKDSDDVTVTTGLMKKVQSDWKKIGHVPRKDSDKIWKQFKAACNHYFDKLHANRNAENKESLDSFNKKHELLDALKDLKLTDDDKEENLKTIKEQINQWKSIGRVPNDKRYIEGKFQKTLDSLFSNLKMDRNEIEMIKFENKLDNLSNASDDNRNLDNERSFIRKKIDEVKGQINQLENNLQFFTNADDDNPLVKAVHNNIKAHKESLDLWNNKLKRIKKLY